MSLTPILITGIICALIGVAIGSLLSGLYKETKEQSQEAPNEDDWIEQVTLVSDKNERAIYPRFQGQIYQSVKEMPPEQRQSLMKILKELRIWFGEPEAAEQAPAPSPPAAAVQTAVEEPPVQPETLVQTLTPPEEKTSMSPIDFFAKAIKTEVKQPSSAPKSIVAQIDDILQEKIEGSAMEKRGIRLVELPGKGMVVVVGLDQFEGIDEVPDEEIRQLIRGCAKEWENRLEFDSRK
ncbi:MAG: hypothetical protein JW908_15980 [Anaerolineales bacterium]|nr:hypothetical protein [Anaerolineales bacterium]